MKQTYYAQVIYLISDGPEIFPIGIFKVQAESTDEAYLRIKSYILEHLDPESDKEGYIISRPRIESEALTTIKA